MTNERDAALIAEARRLAAIDLNRRHDDPRLKTSFEEHLIRLVREGWQPPEPEPDEATVFWQEVMARWMGLLYPSAAEEYKTGQYSNSRNAQAAIAFTRETFARIREEAEARGAARGVDVPEDVQQSLKAVMDGHWSNADVGTMCDFIYSLNERNHS